MTEGSKTYRTYMALTRLLNELDKRELSGEVLDEINSHIESLNNLDDTEKPLVRASRRAVFDITRILEKKLKLVPQNHYRNQWFPIGMAAFGIPIGVAFSVAVGSFAFIGSGMPVGLVIGWFVGMGMDKKARAQGRQLDFEVKF